MTKDNSLRRSCTHLTMVWAPGLSVNKRGLVKRMLRDFLINTLAHTPELSSGILRYKIHFSELVKSVPLRVGEGYSIIALKTDSLEKPSPMSLNQQLPTSSTKGLLNSNEKPLELWESNASSKSTTLFLPNAMTPHKCSKPRSDSSDDASPDRSQSMAG